MEKGYWTRFEVRLVQAGRHIPHGIKYSLTLHDSNNRRILGYDNAHGIKVRKGIFNATTSEWDHKHERNKVKIYAFASAGELLTDFWQDVDNIIKHAGRNVS